MNISRATAKKHATSDRRAMQDNLGDLGDSIANLASDQYEQRLSSVLLERLGPAIIGLQRVDLPMASHVHHAKHVSSRLQR